MRTRQLHHHISTNWSGFPETDSWGSIRRAGPLTRCSSPRLMADLVGQEPTEDEYTRFYSSPEPEQRETN